jgi:hypothetical protein
MKSPRSRLPLVLLLCCLSVPASSQDEYSPVRHPELATIRASGAIDVDGVLDDAGWVGVPRADTFAEHNPGDQTRPPVDTHAWITYDDDHLYIAYKCFDDPDRIRASFTERDRIWSDDYVITAIDTYADQSWAYEIAVNPLGIQGDLLWSANGGEDMGYDLVFESAGRITDEGWIVELAVPWSSLRFPNRDEQTWRVDFWRNHPREVRGQYSWAAYDRDDSCWPCQWGTVHGIRGVKPGKGIEILPSQVFTQSGGRDGASDWTNSDVFGDVSVGAKVNLSSSFTVESTYNPDFSQIEADADQIDVNSTFALFFDERRPFFQEGSDMFRTYFNAVYTRSINDPVFAAKLTGRPGRTSVAFLSARDDNTPFTLPFQENSEFALGGRSTSNILRVRQSLGDGSSLGLLTTDRRIDGGGYNTLAGFDGRIRLTGQLQFEFQALGTDTEEPDDTSITGDLDGATFDGGRRTRAFDGESFKGRAGYASLEYSDRRWDFDVDYWEYSPTFRADNGFQPNNDRRDTHAFMAHTFRYDDHPLLNWWSPRMNVGRVWNWDGQKKDEWVWAGLAGSLKWAQAWIELSHMESNENFGGLQFNGIDSWDINAQILPSESVRGGFSLRTGHRIARGDLILGKETGGMVWFDLKPVDRFLFETSLRWVRNEDEAAGETLFEGYILRSRWGLQFSQRLSARLVIQYNDFRESWEADPLVTYRINPFSTFYFGSTRDYETIDPEGDSINAWRLTDRQYFMKLQYLFQI